MPKGEAVLRNATLEKNLLEYIVQCVLQADGQWDETLSGSVNSAKMQMDEYRARYNARRSVASLDQDVKNTPFERSSNVGICAEQIFGEFLIPTFLANTHDLEPMLQAQDRSTRQVDEALTAFHDHYHRVELAGKRQLLEESTRDLLRVGTVFHKWTYGSLWRQTEASLTVWMHPFSKQPILVPDETMGKLTPIIADPKTPEDAWPMDPSTGMKLKLGTVPSVDVEHLREGPMLTVRPVEAIGFPRGTNTVDPNTWDWLSDRFSVSPWWFLGREGDPFDGKLQHIDKLWKWLGVSPETIWRRPNGVLTEPIELVEWHGKFPVTASGRPVEIIALVAWQPKLLLAWRISPVPRRPYFNRQVWSRGQHPHGKGIPETVYGLRAALDASVNMDVDNGRLFNQPPLLLSSGAMLEDEDYESTGPGAQWVMLDINGAKFLPPPVSHRNPIERENYLLSMMQRVWGVTDLNSNAPTQSLSPNVSTATGVVSVLNQGSIKFSHLTRRLAEVDSQEYQFCHDLFGKMLANPLEFSLGGQPVQIHPKDRESFFRKGISVMARGNGLSTNPMLRKQTLGELYPLLAGNPFIAGDLEAFKDLTEQLVEASGIELELKDPQVLEQSRIFLELMQTPEGQQAIPAIMQQVMLAVQQRAQSQTNTTVKPGGPPVPAQGA